MKRSVCLLKIGNGQCVSKKNFSAMTKETVTFERVTVTFFIFFSHSHV